MPADEFDAYLKTLSARLRLRPGRRAELADELRDHLETRLEELTADGLPRAAAIERALEEFGDAAGLASQMSSAFTVLARRRRRKTLMRVTASAAATLACGIAVAYLFAPPNRAVNPPGPALAQEELDPPQAEPEPGTGDPFAVGQEVPPPAAASPDAAKMAALEKALNAPTELGAQPGDTLAEVLEGLASQHGIVILPDGPSLDIEGVDLRDLPMENPPQLSGYSLRTVLNLLLSSVSAVPLTAVPRDGILFITTKQRAGLDLETRIYNVRDLLADVRTSPQIGLGGGGGGFGNQGFGGGAFSLTPVQNQFGGGGGMGGGGFGSQLAPGASAEAADDLVNMILSVTGGEAFGGPWTMVNGEGGTIEHFNGLLAVRQTAAVHRQIEELLAALRRSAEERGWDAAAPGVPTAAAPNGAEAPLLTVVVGAKGIVSIDGEGGLTPEEIRALLKLHAATAPQRPVVLEAAENVPSRAVRLAIELLSDQGLDNVALRAAGAPNGGAPAGGGAQSLPSY